MAEQEVAQAEVQLMANAEVKQEHIRAKLLEAFGEEITKAFKDEEIDCETGITDLLERDSDSPIFLKLGMSYGKVLRFKTLFGEQRVKRTVKTSPAPSSKPSMTDLAVFSPEVRRKYLTKRKRIGVLASEHWKNKFPKFNTPESKTELKRFIEKISDVCALPEAGFYSDGIEEHVRTYFSEQRRFNKKKLKNGLVYSPPPESSSCTSSDVELSSSQLPSLPSMKQDARPSSVSSDEEDYKSDSGDTVILDNEETPDVQEYGKESTKEPSNGVPSKMTRKSATVIVKAGVPALSLERDDVVRLLKGKFKVPIRSLTDLTPSSLLEILARKLVKNKFVSITNGKDASFHDLKKGDVTVHKEIDFDNS